MVVQYTLQMITPMILNQLNAGVMAGYAKIFNDIKLTKISIEFYNNTAGFAGAAIYGGWVDFCIFNAKEESTLQFETGMSQTLFLTACFNSTSQQENYHLYLLIRHVYVCALTCPSLSAASLSTQSQPILERH